MFLTGSASSVVHIYCVFSRLALLMLPCPALPCPALPCPVAIWTLLCTKTVHVPTDLSCLILCCYIGLLGGPCCRAAWGTFRPQPPSWRLWSRAVTSSPAWSTLLAGLLHRAAWDLKMSSMALLVGVTVHGIDPQLELTIAHCVCRV